MSDVVIKLSAVDAASGVLERVAQNVRGVGQAASAQHGAFGALEQVAVGALRQIGAAAVNLATTGLAALGDQLRSSIDVAATFESALYKFQAVAGDSLTKVGLSFDDVKAKALELGSSTQFSAQQALDAMTELLKGGVNVKEVMTGATDATLALAAAAQLDLANAATIVAKQLGVWGETGVTAANVADLLASAANASTVDVEELALGLANVGGSAKVAGLSFQETVQTMALIAPSFSSAADAGTSLKTFLQRLIPTTKDATRMMVELGLATEDGKSKFFDAKGNFIGMEAAARLLHDATKNLSEEQKFLALNTIFGTDAIRAAAAISVAGAVGYNEMGQAMRDAGGAAQAAAIMQQGYKFTLDQFNAAVETLQITVGSALLPHLTRLVAAAAEGVNVFTSWVSGILNAADPVAALAAQIGLVGVTTGSVQQMITDAATVIFATWNSLSAALAPSTQTAWSAVQQAVRFATALVTQIWNTHGADILAFAKRTWEGIMSVVTEAARFIQAVIETLVTAVQWVWRNFGSEITAVVQFAWNQIKTSTETVLAALRGLFEAGTATLRSDWSAVWNAVQSTVQTALAAVQQAVQFITALVTQIWNTHGADILAFAKRTWEGIISVIVAAAQFVQAAIEALVAAAQWIWVNFGNEITAAVQFAWNLIKTLTETTLSILRGLFEAGTAALSSDWSEVWNAVRSTVQTALAAVQQAVQFVTTLVVQIWNAHGADILAFAKRTWEGIIGVVIAAARFLQAAIEALTAAAQWIWANFGNEITAVAQFAWNLIKTLTETTLSVLRGLFEAGTAALRGDWSAAWEAIKRVAEALWNGIRTSAEHLMNTLSLLFQSLYPRLEEAFRHAIAGAASLGAALIDGIRSGVESAARGLAQAAADAAKAALDAAKAALGIRSPSRVAAREVGVPLAEGILRGLTEGLAPLPLLTRDAVTQPPPASATVNVGGITVNAAPGMDERRLATLVRSEIDNLTRLARFGRV